jgi:hypothetical protein
MPINLFAKDLDEDDAVNEQYQALTYCFFHPSSHGTYRNLLEGVVLNPFVTNTSGANPITFSSSVES